MGVQEQQKLRLKGIDKELSSQTVENLNLDEKEEIRALISKKYIRKLSDEADLRRTVAALQRRGFSYGDIRSVIREFTEFGSGFHIAMRDLELRGAGNVLGANQHGHMESVGYEMYVKLLEQAIQGSDEALRQLQERAAKAIPITVTITE